MRSGEYGAVQFPGVGRTGMTEAVAASVSMSSVSILTNAGDDELGKLSLKAFSQEMNRFTSLENLISNLREGRLLALTAPFVTDKIVLVGYAAGPEKGYCANVFCTTVFLFFMDSGISAVKNSLT